MEFVLLILISSAVSSGGGLLLKSGLRQLEGGMEMSPEGVLRVLMEPRVILGLFVYFVGAITWMKVLSRYQLSTAYPVLVGTSFLLITCISVLAMKETLNIYKIMGVVGIITGIVLIVRNP